jgi:hypothetical protein
MSKKDYKTQRNKKSKEFSVKLIRENVALQRDNSQTIKMLFSKELIQQKMNQWEKNFIDSLKTARYQWSQKQIDVLRSIELKYQYTLFLKKKKKTKSLK